MTNYDQIMADMTVEKMAASRVKTVSEDCHWNGGWHEDSFGNEYIDYVDAISAETAWLKKEVE
jgi:hypothetical protein